MARICPSVDYSSMLASLYLNPDEPVDPKEKPVAAAGLSLAVAAAAAAADPNEKAGLGAAGFSGDAWTAAGVAAAAPLPNAKPPEKRMENNRDFVWGPVI